MDKKTCFKCNIEKPLAEYYKHKDMRDGRLNKCKDCTKEGVKERVLVLSENSEWVEREKSRHRAKYFRLGYKEKHKPNREDKKATQDRYKSKYPEKCKARNCSQSIPSINGHNHHWSYNKEHYKDVIDISEKDHAKAHRFIVYDQERMMYRRIDNMELLDTKEKHIEWIEWCIKNKED